MDELPSGSDDWFLVKLEQEGEAGFARISMERSTADPERPHFLHLQVGLAESNAEGFPTPEEFDFLENLEEELIAWSERNLAAEMVAVFTWPGVRDYLFYGKRPFEPGAAALELQLMVGEREVSVAVEEDPAWEIYLPYVREANEAAAES